MILLGCMDLDFALRVAKPVETTLESPWDEIMHFDKWERSNRLSLMIIKRGIPESFWSSISTCVTVASDFLEEIQNRFVKNDKADTNTLLTSLVSMKYTNKGNIQKYILEMSNVKSFFKA